jgi:transcriptional regulator with XRE-family HTH domain
MTTDSEPRDTIGPRIRHHREQKDLSLSRLAREAGVSKGYLWSLENRPDGDSAQRPSAQTLFAIAKALGVTMADLLGEQLVLDDEPVVDPTLREFAELEGLPQADVQMLASIQWRGDRPTSVERWRFIYHAIVTSRSLDDSAD